MTNGSDTSVNRFTDYLETVLPRMSWSSSANRALRPPNASF